MEGRQLLVFGVARRHGHPPWGLDQERSSMTGRRHLRGSVASMISEETIEQTRAVVDLRRPCHPARRSIQRKSPSGGGNDGEAADAAAGVVINVVAGPVGRGRRWCLRPAGSSSSPRWACGRGRRPRRMQPARESRGASVRPRLGCALRLVFFVRGNGLGDLPATW